MRLFTSRVVWGTAAQRARAAGTTLSNYCDGPRWAADRPLATPRALISLALSDASRELELGNGRVLFQPALLLGAACRFQPIVSVQLMDRGGEVIADGALRQRQPCCDVGDAGAIQRGRQHITL